MKRILVLAAGLAVVGCGSKERMPYLGRWSGKLVVEGFAKGADTPARRKVNEISAELQMYATENRVKLLLEGKQQSVEINGNWTLRAKGGVEIKPSGLRNDDQGGEEFRDSSLPYVSTQDLQATFARPIILKPSKDGQTLNGLPVGLGDLIVRFELKRDML